MKPPGGAPIQPAAIGLDGRIGTLIKQEGVVFDVAVVTEPEVSDDDAVTRAQISAHPVVVELVEVGTGTDADAACPRRCAREPLVARGGVTRDRVVVDVYGLRQYGS
jgi:hypothetical protein